MLARLRITTCINVTLFLAVFGTAEEALRESEARLQFALEAANAGTWEGVPETGEFTASDRALALHGLPPGTLMTQEKAAAAAHPDDRPRVMEALRHTLETGQPYRIELRMPLPDGSTRWVEACGEPRFASGRRVVSGLLQDITERKRAEIALRESEEILRAIIERVHPSVQGGSQDPAHQPGFDSSDRLHGDAPTDRHRRHPGKAKPYPGS